MILTLNNLTYSQQEENKIDSLVTEFTSELKLKGVNDFFSVKIFCVGGTKIVFPNECDSFYETYLFWRINNKSFIKKFDTCKNYRQIDITETKIIESFIESKDNLKNEIVKKYTTIENGGNSTVLETDHSCFRMFQFQTENDSFINKFDLFDLTTDSADKNLYYESNNKLRLVELSKMCDKLISKIENGRQFEQ